MVNINTSFAPPDLIALSALPIHSVDFEEIRYEMVYVLK